MRADLLTPPDRRYHTIAAVPYPDDYPTRAGRCYELAFKECADLGRVWGKSDPNGWVLVHGTITGFGYTNPHAWVRRPDGTVWDPALNTVFHADDHRAIFQPDSHDEYTVSEANDQALATEHYGPWPQAE